MILSAMLFPVVATHANPFPLSADIVHEETIAVTSEALPPTGEGISLKEFSIRYWRGKGKSSWSHCASVACGGPAFTYLGQPIQFGDPSSRLNPRDLAADTTELHGTLGLGSSWVLSGSFGLGAITSGQMHDQDWADLRALGFGAQALFSSTQSEVKDGRLDYLTLDLGRESRFVQLGVTPFLGIVRHREMFNSYGVVFMPDDIGFGATQPGVSEAVRVLSHKITWQGLRLGLEATYDISDAARIGLKVAYLPWARGKIEDSHHLRPDLGAPPNVLAAANGKGWMFDLVGHHRFSSGPLRNWSGQLGYRFWKFESKDGRQKYGPAFSTAFPLRDFTTERSGVLVGASYVF